MFHLMRQTSQNFLVVMAFRGSGKSTILNTANVLWSILGKPKKKFVVIVSKTQEQSKNHFSNIKAELENNEQLKDEFGPFIESNNDFDRKLSLELEYHGAKILCVTKYQSVRGLKHGIHRPDLIICDDLEDEYDVTSTTSRQEVDRLQRHFQSEIVPLGNTGTRIIVLGNLLSELCFEDSIFLIKLKEQIEKGEIQGIFRAYPIIDDNCRCLWSEKFPDPQSLMDLRSQLSMGMWLREYLLKTFGQGENDAPNVTFENGDSTYLKRLFKSTRWKMGVNENSSKQMPLIKQMEKFTISAPAHPVWFFKSQKDPEYLRMLNGLYLKR